MADIDINQITNAVVAELRNGATDMAGITPSTALNDSDNVLAQNGGTLKKLPVSLFKQIVAAGATVYRLTADSQVYKATTTSVAIGVTKSEGGEVTVLSTLPTGWKIGVHCESGDSYADNYYSAPTSIDPHAWETVAVTLYDGDPQSSTSAQAVDIVTLRLVSDGTDGAKGDKGDTGTLANFPIVECTGEIVLSDCHPNRIYKCSDSITTVSVDVIHYSDGTNGTDFSAHGDIADEYCFDFVAGASCQVSLPSAVTWAYTPTFTEGKRYLISIVDNCGIAAEFSA